MAKKSARRKKTSEKPQSFHPHEIVEIERNFVEQTLLDLKHWAQRNQALFRKIIYGVVGVAVLVFLFVFLDSQAQEQASVEYYKILDKYEKARILPLGDNRNKELRKVAGEAHKLCSKFWSTNASMQGCLLEGLAFLAAKENALAAKAFEKYADYFSGEPPASYALYYAGIAREATGEFTKAYSHFDKLAEAYKSIKKEDVALFHKGRILYNKQEYKLAEKMFREILDKHKASPYLKEARQYLALIRLQK